MYGAAIGGVAVFILIPRWLASRAARGAAQMMMRPPRGPRFPRGPRRPPRPRRPRFPRRPRAPRFPRQPPTRYSPNYGMPRGGQSRFGVRRYVFLPFSSIH